MKYAFIIIAGLLLTSCQTFDKDAPFEQQLSTIRALSCQSLAVGMGFAKTERQIERATAFYNQFCGPSGAGS